MIVTREEASHRITSHCLGSRVFQFLCTASVNGLPTASCCKWSVLWLSAEEHTLHHGVSYNDRTGAALIGSWASPADLRLLSRRRVLSVRPVRETERVWLWIRTRSGLCRQSDQDQWLFRSGRYLVSVAKFRKLSGKRSLI